MKTLFENDPLTSVRTVSKKLGIPRSTVSDIKIKRWGIVARTQKKAPKYVKDQERRAKTGLRKIYKKTRERVLVIDDETYVIVDTKEQPGRKFVHSNKHEELPFNQKFKQITKFPKKYLVWQAIDENGNISKPYISDRSMTAEIYLNECLKKRLLPFIEEHYAKDEILFWPDLATVHYAKKCVEFCS